MAEKNEYAPILTDIGRAKIIAAVALGETLQFSEMAVGNGSPVAPDKTQAELVSEVYRANLNTLTKDPQNPNWLVAEMVIPSDVGGWAINEVGIFDNIGDLVVIGKLPNTYKPLVAEGSAREMLIRVVVQLNDPDVVELIIDPSIVMATQKWVEDRIESGVEPGVLVRLDDQARLPGVDGSKLKNIRQKNREYFYGQI